MFQYFRKISNLDDNNYVVDEDIYEYMRLYEIGVLSIKYNELNNTLSDSEVELAIKQLKRGKAVGCDHLINELYTKRALYYQYTKKAQWKIIVELLLCTLGQLFTRIIDNRLNYWSDTYHIINDNQSGFRRGMSTADNNYIYIAICHCCSRFYKGKKVFCASIDFSKAFDYINRVCLWYNLLKSGISGNIFNINKNIYMNTFCEVKYEGAMSDQFECNIAVRQYSVNHLFSPSWLIQ